MMGFKRNKRVGVVGLLQSGKTVLLTSLIAHLRNHDKDALRLDGGGAEIVGHCELNPRTTLDRFPFEHIRQRLGQRLWPKKTLMATEYRSLNVRIDRKQRRTSFDLSLYDIPGERLVDLIIADCKHYDEWADRIRKELDANPRFQNLMAPYFEALRKLGPDAQAPAIDGFILEYKRGLARLGLAHAPIVTPSTFLITHDGQLVSETLKAVPRDEWIEKLAAERPCGISLEKQFVPLDAAARTALPNVVKQFRQHYAEYRRQVVLPFAKPLQECDELLVLADIPMLLRGGPGMYDAQVKLLEFVFDTLKPGFGRLGKLVNRAGLLSGIRRVTFVATKADRVPKCDHDTLLSLLSQLTQTSVKKHKVRHFETDFLVCSAVQSAGPDGDEPRRLTWQERNGQADKPVRFSSVMPELPPNWKLEWQPRDFDSFPDPDPWMPPTIGSPPDHLCLEDIVERILS